MYVGRIVAVGMTDRSFVAYRVSSRSFPNRVARITDLGAAIQPIDPEDMKKNPYIAYNCLRVSKNGAVVSNGSHTDPIFERLESGTPPDVALQEVLTEMGYERDDFNTPRIAGIATELIVAAVAVFDPLIAEKAAEARIVVIARPPFRWPNQRFVAW